MKYSKEWLSKAEIRTLFSHPDLRTRDLLLYKTCYYGGFRISEVLKSKREDYRDEDYTYLILREQKTDKMNWEPQPIPRHVYADVLRFCNDNKIKTQDHVFQSNRKKPLSYNTVYKNLKKACEACGIKKEVTTHSFRRSRATHLLNDGLSIYKVSTFLRHKQIRTTIKYLKLSKKRLSDDVAKIDNKFFEEI